MRQHPAVSIRASKLFASLDLTHGPPITVDEEIVEVSQRTEGQQMMWAPNTYYLHPQTI